MVASLERLYSVARTKNLHNGVAYIITGDRNIIEARLYNDILINLTSRKLSHEQIMGCLLSGDVSEIGEGSADIKLDDVQAATIAETFPACSSLLFSTDDRLVQRLFDVMQVLACLSNAGAEGRAAFGVVYDEITKSFPKFSLSGETIRKRIDEFLNDFLIAYPFGDNEPVPSDSRLLPGWVFDRLKMPPGMFRNIFVHYIFFGDIFESVVRTIIKKDNSFGAKIGHARMSRIIYSDAAKSGIVIIFKGALEVGRLKLINHTEKKTGIQITQTDLDKLGIRDGDTVSLIFRNKPEV